MKTPNVKMSLKTKMTLTVLLLVTGLLSSAAFITYFYFEKQFKKSISLQQLTMISQLAEQIDDKIQTARDQLAIIARNINPAELRNAAKMQEILDGQKEHRTFFDEGILLISKEKKLIAESPYYPGRRGKDYAFREYVTKTLRTGKPFISNPYLTTVPPYHPSIAFAVPVFDAAGRVAAVLAGRHDLLSDNFLGKLASASIGNSGYLYIFNAERTIVMHRDKKRILETVANGANKGFEKAIKGYEGTLENVNSKGVEGLTSFKRLKSTNWILAAHYPLQEAYAPLYTAKNFFYAALVSAAIFSIVVVWLVMKNLTAPLLAFTRHIAELPDKDGVDKLIPITSGDEIGAMADAFNGMVLELDKQKAALQKSAEIYRVVAEFTTELAAWRAPDGTIRYISPNCQAMTGYEDTEFYLSAGLLERIIHPDDRSLWASHVREIDENGIHRPVDFRIVTKAGDVRWISHSCHTVINQAGEFLGVRGSYRDITERKRIEEDLKDEKEFAENLINNASAPIFVVNAQHKVVFWNRACEELTGVKAEKMLGTDEQWKAFYDHKRPSLADLIIDGKTDKMATHYDICSKSHLIAEGLQAEGWYPNLGGKERYIFFDAAPLRNGRGELVAVIETFRDITQRKRAEEELRKFSLAVEQSPASIVITDTEGTIEYVNPKFTRITGYSREEAIGQNPRILKSGETDPAKYKELWHTITTGGEWQGEFYNRKKNGEFFWESALIAPITNLAGVITHFMAIKEDITGQKHAARELNKNRAELMTKHEELKGLYLQMAGKNRELEAACTELKSTQAQMLQREKMASIGQLAAGVAHEINNPIGFVSSNLGTLDKYVARMTEFIGIQGEKLAALGPPEHLGEVEEKRKRLKLDYIMEDTKQLIRESLDGTDRVRKIVQDLKTFSRVDEAEFKHADINECLESTVNIVWNEIKYKANLKREFGELPQIQCYPQQLNQVFLNLLINAAHAIEKQGEITVRSWQENGAAFVSVTDTGCGIPPEIQNRIFEPFYTTKEVGKGTGLGLSISYDIVKKHNGDIYVASEPGKGTTFTVRIPVVEVEDH
ncbi:MAG: multi-sensor hybrid histidine [Geobacteraceae bacterium]|nr:MAG: multi-sensor hybrid histidine [Geobacteraceae bacterium]